ncbi:MAG: hypothetical protein AWU58_1625 [Methanohalophilus sp. T328-1]|jgi:hypothetical protein|uniref:Uncharacterized protein n=1 Tax=Methanohalophilus euhalobius TaxID=51203 RepID=A0A285G7P0_9EURY|nr:MAG: hypothetical protein AWU58_1625 [Methanohalophilus sp. T328-1]ODV49735.1 MAG: hypothetical protein A8273_1003 [Methanohalophilus sp. 2-GBenrich]PQV42266.1 hypothetical protein B0H22_10742 [Methanohalophilus euhalobius]RXG34514.1 hypothetical protein CI957_952 [Methanohalophilus sp. WG1-DM]RNI07846.1 hypothetical protein EDD83_07900 [Methanohalophilus euhalobius]
MKQEAIWFSQVVVHTLILTVYIILTSIIAGYLTEMIVDDESKSYRYKRKDMTIDFQTVVNIRLC